MKETLQVGEKRFEFLEVGFCSLINAFLRPSYERRVKILLGQKNFEKIS